MLEVYMGSRAYGCNDPGSSDYDIYGIVMPPRVYIFPHTDGLIPGYDNCPIFKQWQEHHVQDSDGKRSYDFSIYNIVRFFQLSEENNPNMVDMLFIPEVCVKHCSPVGRLILDNRRLFLSKLCWKKFRGYASDQFHKLKERNPEGKRKELVEKYGYDIKFGYHVIRLLREAEQILTEGDLNLQIGNQELKSIRNGEWSFDRLEKEFEIRKIAVETNYANCKLQEVPDHAQLKQLLLNCLEMHYGSLDKICPRLDASAQALRDIAAIVDKNRSSFDHSSLGGQTWWEKLSIMWKS